MTDPTRCEAPETFHRCQLCGKGSDDICEFRMWQRCDENDNRIEDFLITCHDEACFKVIDDHELLFIQVEWSRGGPGRFMLICGNCPQRQGWSCHSPDLKSNGGNGLRVGFTPTFLSGIRICLSDGRSISTGPPATSCDGNPNQKVPEKARDVPADQVWERAR